MSLAFIHTFATVCDTTQSASLGLQTTTLSLNLKRFIVDWQCFPIAFSNILLEQQQRHSLQTDHSTKSMKSQQKTADKLHNGRIQR